MDAVSNGGEPDATHCDVDAEEQPIGLELGIMMQDSRKDGSNVLEDIATCAWVLSNHSI